MARGQIKWVEITRFVGDQSLWATLSDRPPSSTCANWWAWPKRGMPAAQQTETSWCLISEIPIWWSAWGEGDNIQRPMTISMSCRCGSMTMANLHSHSQGPQPPQRAENQDLVYTRQKEAGIIFWLRHLNQFGVTLPPMSRLGRSFVNNTKCGKDVIFGPTKLSRSISRGSKFWMASFVVLLHIAISVVKLMSVRAKDEFSCVG